MSRTLLDGVFVAYAVLLGGGGALYLAKLPGVLVLMATVLGGFCCFAFFLVALRDAVEKRRGSVAPVGQRQRQTA